MSGFNRYRGNTLRIQQSTQPITITDIMAAPYEQLPNGNPLGEFNMPVPNNNKNRKRLILRI